jgi:peptidoglycan/LPS O-acetylase OafA/YrhL
MKASQEHIAFLDHIRGVAILSVFLYHSLDPSFGADHFLFKGLWRSWESAGSLPFPLFPVTLGWLGVAIFFVVSGFCVHLSHRRSSDQKLSTFFLRRFFRIYPPYLIALLIFAFLFPPTWLDFRGSFLMSLTQLSSHLLMVHNLDYRLYFGINGVFWSVAIEVQLYMLYPLLLWLVGKYGWRKMLWMTALIEIAMRILLGLYGHNYSLVPYIAGIPFLYWYSWTIGAALAEAYLMKEPLPFSRTPIFLWPAVTLAAYLFEPLYPFTFLFSALSTACFIAYFLRLPPAVFSQPKHLGFLFEHLRFAGVISYSVYLLHQPLINSIPIMLKTLFPGVVFPDAVIMLICFAGWLPVCLLAYAFYSFIELPSISLGKWIIQARRPIRAVTLESQGIGVNPPS